MIVPQSWIGPAIAAAAMTFGPLHGPDPVRIHYHRLPSGNLARADPVARAIVLDPRRSWYKPALECTLAHEYGHLRAYDRGRRRWWAHSTNPRSLMYVRLVPATCDRWLRRHHLH